MSRYYSIDTSALLDGLERFYPAANFPRLWEKMDELIASGRLLMSEEAWDESRRIDAPAKDWCDELGSGRDQCKYLTDNEVAAVVGQILSDYPQWVTQGRRNGADPFVIAVAEVAGAMVISGESNGGPSKPKIPYVCDQRDVECGRFIDLIVNEGWVIG